MSSTSTDLSKVMCWSRSVCTLSHTSICPSFGPSCWYFSFSFLLWLLLRFTPLNCRFADVSCSWGTIYQLRTSSTSKRRKTLQLTCGALQNEVTWIFKRSWNLEFLQFALSKSRFWSGCRDFHCPVLLKIKTSNSKHWQLSSLLTVSSLGD